MKEGCLIDYLMKMKDRNDAASDGRVAPGRFGDMRIKDIVSIATDPCDSEELKHGNRADWYHKDTYKKDNSVSIEGAYSRESDMRDVLDGRVTAENIGWDEEGSKGLKPCDLLEKAKTQKR